MRCDEKQTDKCPILVVIIHLLNDNFVSLWHGSAVMELNFPFFLMEQVRFSVRILREANKPSMSLAISDAKQAATLDTSPGKQNSTSRER